MANRESRQAPQTALLDNVADLARQRRIATRQQYQIATERYGDPATGPEGQPVPVRRGDR